MKIVTTIDPQLQEEVASAVLNDPWLAEAIYRLVYANDFFKKSKVELFSNPTINKIARAFFTAYEKNGHKTPSVGLVCNHISNASELTPAERESLRADFLRVQARNLRLDDGHETFLKEIIADAYTSTFVNLVVAKIKIPSPTFLKEVRATAVDFAQKVENISFVDSDTVTFDNIKELIEEMGREAYQNVPTGLKELDQELNGGGDFGGASAQEVTVWLAPTNAGKTFILGAVGAHAVKLGKSVRYIALEGKKNLVPTRIIANFTGISIKKIVRYREYIARNPNEKDSLTKYFSKEDIVKIEEAEVLCKGKISVIHAILNSNIEYIEKKVAEEYAKNPFQVLLVDYGQLIESIRPELKKEADVIQYVFRRLEILSARFKLVTHVAMQTNREGMSYLSEQEGQGNQFPVVQTYHVAGGISALKTAGCIIAVSCTPDERKSGKLRFTIIKQREGIVGVEVGIFSQFDYGNPFEGKRFRNFHPLHNFTEGANDKEFKVKGKGNNQSPPPPSNNGGRPDNLEKSIVDNFVLKQFVHKKWSESLDETKEKLIKIFNARQGFVEMEQQLKKASSGLEVMDDADKDKLAEEVTSRKRIIAENTDDILMNRDELEDYKKFEDHLFRQLSKMNMDQEKISILKEIAKTNEGIDNFIKHIEMINLLQQSEVLSKI